MGLTANTGPYNAAAEHYGVDDPVMLKIPRSKYQFNLELTINSSDPLAGQQGPYIFHRVEGISLPDYNYNVTRVNEYNRIRYISTRVEYTPFTVNFYDTKDNAWQHIMQAYARHYSHGHNVDPNATLQNNPTAPAQFSPFGITAVAAQERFFFPRIRVLQTDSAQSGRIISMYNCMITQINHDRLAYSDSSPILWSVQFQPEQVNLDSVSASNGSAQAQGANSVSQPYDVSRSQSAGLYIGQDGRPIRDNTGNTIPIGAALNFNSEGVTGSLFASFGGLSVGVDAPILRRDRNGQPQPINRASVSASLPNLPAAASRVISDIRNFFS
jgi:hypothetical protein